MQGPPRETVVSKRALQWRKYFRAACLGPLGPRAPCMAGSAGAVVTPLVGEQLGISLQVEWAKNILTTTLLKVHLCGPLYLHGHLHLHGPFTCMGPFGFCVALLHLCRAFYYAYGALSPPSAPPLRFVGGLRRLCVRYSTTAVCQLFNKTMVDWFIGLWGTSTP